MTGFAIELDHPFLLVVGVVVLFGRRISVVVGMSSFLQWSLAVAGWVHHGGRTVLLASKTQATGE